MHLKLPLIVIGLLSIQSAEAGALRFNANAPQQYDFADQAQLPPSFGRGEFTMEFWFKADHRYPVGPVYPASIGQLRNWAEEDPKPYSSTSWWYEGNWLLDGHSRPEGYLPHNTREGTFSLQFYGGGRLRWTFSDDSLAVPIGKVWAVQAWPADSTVSLLDGRWHYAACVRRWSDDGKAQLELWIDGKLIAQQAIPYRTDMRKFWDALPHPNDPKELGGWSWASEVMTSWDYFFTQYEDYKGLLDELRFWDRARSATELSNEWQNAVNGNEPGLVGWFDFEEGRGKTAFDRLDKSRSSEQKRRLDLHRSQKDTWAPDNAPVKVVR